MQTPPKRNEEDTSYMPDFFEYPFEPIFLGKVAQPNSIRYSLFQAQFY